jgi:DNA (cytosine-5)-methyltransferase 1
MIGWTMCSGIGAPEVAAPWVDWRLAAEIENFPRAVLQARFGYKLPEDHNQGDALLWGDMTEVTPDLARSRGVPLPDVLVAGTPCQAFSIAGLRNGTADARGNLTLKFVETCHAIVDARPDGKLAVLWENVPGVLSDKGNAFGCFLGGLVGAVDALQPPGDGSWPGEGMVQGPRARAAWCVLDAQYFGVAQRRRRVFVVVDFGGAVDPAAVLLEPESLRGNCPTRGQEGQNITAGTLRGTDGGSDVDHARARHLTACRMTAIGEYVDDGTASTMKQRDYKDATDLVTHSLRGEGFDASGDGTGRATPLVPVAYRVTGNDGAYETGDVIGALQTGTDRSAQVDAFAENQRGEVRTSETMMQLTCGGGKPGQGYPAVMTPWAVRRLMPIECHRLQGFPDDHTAIEVRGKPAADGPQYKALGNSMAVPCIAWIIDRMKISMEQMRAAP